MFKFIIFLGLCGTMLVESKPSQNVDFKLADDNYGVAKSAQHVQDAMDLAGQLANEGIQVASKGLNILATAAQQGVHAGTAIAAQVTKSATSII